MDLFKKLDNMVTAEEFLVRDELFSKPLTKNEKKFYIQNMIDHNGFINAMIEFAKLHVKVALKQASENFTMKMKEDVMELDMNDDWMEVDKNSILNAYPIENIK